METNTSSQLEILVTIRYVTNNQEATVQVEQFPYLIGRDSSSVQLALPDATVSRKHAQLIYRDGAVLIENISETNKTAVNGQYIDRPTPLSSGDQAILGSSKLFFDIQPIAKPAAPEAETSVTEALPVPEQDESEKSEPAPKEPDPPRPVQSDAPAESHYCRQCGQPLPAQAAFCGICGTAVQAEIVGQPMFCGSCGSKVGQDFRFCPQCGKPVGQGQEQAGAPQAQVEPSHVPSPATPAKRKNNKRLVGIIAVALLVVLLVAVAVVFLGGRSYQSVVKQYMNATLKGDYEKIWSLLPREMRETALDYWEAYGIDDISEIEALIGDSVMESLERAEDEFGKNWKFSYEIVDEDDFSKSEINTVKQAWEFMGIEDAKINGGKSLEIELTISGKNGKTEEDTIYLDVLKIGRSWYLSGLNG